MSLLPFKGHTRINLADNKQRDGQTGTVKGRKRDRKDEGVYRWMFDERGNRQTGGQTGGHKHKLGREREMDKQTYAGTDRDSMPKAGNMCKWGERKA